MDPEQMQSAATMRVLTQYSEAHRVLFDNWFRPSLPPGAELIVNRLDVRGPGDFGSAEWQESLTDKLRFLAAETRAHTGERLVWADADVQFFPTFQWADLEQLWRASGRHFLFQKETRDPASREINTGFFIFEASPEIAAFFERAHEYQLGAERNDQLTINTLLPGFPELTWDFLPLRYYARSQGFPPPGGIVLHHANYTQQGGVPAKMRQLRQIRRMTLGGAVGYATGCAEEAFRRFHRLPHKLLSLLRG